MYAKPIYVSQRKRNTSLTKKMHQSMDSLWVVKMKVPEHSIVGYIGLWVSFMAPIHRWKFDRIPDEKYWEVIEDKVLNTFLGIKFSCPASNIANSVA